PDSFGDGMNADPTLAPTARPSSFGLLRNERAPSMAPGALATSWLSYIVIGLALVFVIAGATDLDLGPLEARLGLSAGEGLGPMGQVVGYWAPDLWPAQVFPSFLLAQLEPLGRPTSAAIRWPAAIAGIIAGWILTRRAFHVLGGRAAVLVAVCWMSSL